MWSSIGLYTEKTATEDMFETGTLKMSMVLDESTASVSAALS